MCWSDQQIRLLEVEESVVVVVVVAVEESSEMVGAEEFCGLLS